jgi:uncharacterized membrane protein
MKFVQRWYRWLVPAARAPWRWAQLIPLILFLLAFFATCAGLEWSRRVSFARPTGLLLVLAGPWIWWLSVVSRSGLGRWRAAIALMSRLLLVGLFAMLLAEPRAVRTSDRLSVMYTVDMSDSIGDSAVDAALRFVSENVTTKPSHDQAGLIVFGRDAAVELPPRTAFPFEAVNSRLDRDATNIARSLSLAAAMLPDEDAGRVVLVSDGISTEGPLESVLDDLRAREIAVDVLPIDYDYDREVWLERMELPQQIKIGENYEAAIILSSLRNGSGQLILTENGREVYRETVQFSAGKNRYELPIYLRQPGYYEYAATIQCERDTDHLRENNTVMDCVFIEGVGRVLLVTDPGGDEREWTDLANVLNSAKREVDVRRAYDLASNSQSFLPYDCILLVNVPADALDATQMKAIHDAVFDLGIGMVMVGGANSFGPGGYHRSVIEDALPVSMDVSQKKILPKGALAIILHTCEFPEGNTWGKRITKQAMKVLSAQDEVGVLCFGNLGEEWLFKLTPAAEYERLAKLVNGAVIGDMPSFATTMQMGLDDLKKSDAATKHMIIISDGDPSPPPPSLVQGFVDHKVSISMVAIFPHGGEDISKMRSIVGVTGGRYYFPDDPNELPAIFIKEAKTLRRNMIQNRRFTPEIGFPSPVLKGVSSMPALGGYVLTTAKPRAQTILYAVSEENGVSEQEPILAIWRYGLGTSAAFTSDLAPNWAAEWMDWESKQPFIVQLITEISRVRKDSHLRLQATVQGNEAVIRVEDYHPQEHFLEVQARVSGPRDRVESVELTQVAPRKYQGSLPAWGKGRYHVTVEGRGGNRQDRTSGGFIISYSPEYLRFTANPLNLSRIAQSTQGEVLEANAEAEAIYTKRKPKTSTRPIFDWFLTALACWIPIDVGLRRVQLDGRMLWNWIRRRSGAPESTPTMGTLLQKKRILEQRWKGTVLSAGRRRAEPIPESRSDTTPTSSSRPAAPEVHPEDVPKKTATQAAPPTTTERLLDLKRKREGERPSE